MKIAFYKSTRPGLEGIFNVLVRWWTKGPYSHCELILEEYPDGTVLCGSSSQLEGGVRLKRMALDPERWDVLTAPLGNRETALGWFKQHQGAGYDYLGLLGFLARPVTGHQRRWFCSEAVGAALGLAESWRFCPNTLAALCERADTSRQGWTEAAG